PGSDAGDDPAGRPRRPGGPDAGHAHRADRPVPPVARGGVTVCAGLTAAPGCPAPGSGARPAGPVVGLDDDHRSGRADLTVLLVPAGQRVDRVRDRALVLDDARPPVDADPPQ